MKSSLLCVIGIKLLCQVFARDTFNDLEALKDKSYLVCADSAGLSSDMILLVKSGEWPEENDILKEWIHCVLLKNELVTEDGEIRLDVALKDLSETEAAKKQANIDKCLPTSSTNVPPEEISWHFAKCFQREDPKNSLF